MSTDECRAMRGELAAVALDRAEEDERTRLKAHVDGCADCRQELAELRRTARALPAASLDHLDTDHLPSTDLGDRIARSARDERRSDRHVRRIRVATAVAGAAAAALLAFGVFVALRDDRPSALQPFAIAPIGAIAEIGRAHV